MSQRPLPPAVYWRRRLLILAVVIALGWLVVRLVGSDDTADPSEPEAAPQVVPAVVPTDGTYDASLPSTSKACDPQQIRITPSVPAQQTAGGEVTIELVVSSAGTGACTLEPDDADLIAVISANGETVWDSTLCPASLLTEPVPLARDWSTVVATTWSGRGSGAGCSADEAFVPAGTYTVKLGTLGGEPGETTFSLAAGDEPEPEPKAEPEPEPAPSESADAPDEE